jgi:hypothetical protein
VGRRILSSSVGKHVAIVAMVMMVSVSMHVDREERACFRVQE